MLVVPIVEDGLEQIGVAILWNFLEETPRDDLAAVLHSGLIKYAGRLPQHVGLVEDNAAHAWMTSQQACQERAISRSHIHEQVNAIPIVQPAEHADNQTIRAFHCPVQAPAGLWVILHVLPIQFAMHRGKRSLARTQRMIDSRPSLQE